MSTSITSNASDSVIQINGQDALPINLGGSANKLASITCTQNAGALTFTLNPCVEEFRNASLLSGVPNLRKINTALSLALPSSGILGFPTTISGRIILAVIDVDADTQELAICALAGGLPLSEENLITTVAIGTGSDSANVWYSTTARTGVPYKIKGAVDVVNTAGAWGNPTLVVSAGGNALTAMSSLGYGQTWQNLTASRAMGATYYNTTGKAIYVAAAGAIGGTTSNMQITIAGVIVTGATIANAYTSVHAIVPNGAAYMVNANTGTPAMSAWAELR